MRSPGTAAGRRGAVPAWDDPPAGGRPPAHPPAGRADRLVTSPAPRARVDGAEVDERLRPWDLGRWTGLPLAQLPADELARWRADPSWRGHGGESLADVGNRVRALLDQWRGADGRITAVTHAGVVRAAVLGALRAPDAAAWDLDVRPGSVTELHATGTGWRVVRVGCRD